MNSGMNRTKDILTIVCILLAGAACVLLAAWEKDQPESPDLTVYDNGYGTVFVTGTRIEHPADTSSSICVDWSGAPAAKASETLRVTEKKGIVYSRSTVTDGLDAGDPLKLHLNLSYAAEQKGKKPVIVLVPGGGFITCRIDNKYTGVQKYLIDHGYAVAIIEYHIIGQGRYMDAAEDVREAVRWVRKNADEYDLDPSRIALIGNSGGGYVAALAACQDASDIRCVVNFYGLSDLLNNKADYEDAAVLEHHKITSSDSQFVNGVLSGLSLTDDPEEAAKADPASYIDGDEPPFLHLHGDADLLVSPSQSVHLHEALLDAGVESIRYSVAGAGHGDPAFRSKPALDIVLEFLDRCCGWDPEQRQD